MKTKLFALWLFAAYVTSAGYAQIYADKNWSPMGKPDEYPPDRYPSLTRHDEKFPDTQEKYLLDGDDEPKLYKVETVVVNTEVKLWSDDEASGRAGINALTSWVTKNSPNGDGDYKVIVRAEPNLISPENERRGALDGMKVSFIRLRHHDSRQAPRFCFIPYLNSEGKITHVVISETDAQVLEKKMVSAYRSDTQVPLWYCRKGHVRQDNLVSFGGVWVAFSQLLIGNTLVSLPRIEDQILTSRLVGAPQSGESYKEDAVPPEEKEPKKKTEDNKP